MENLGSKALMASVGVALCAGIAWWSIDRSTSTGAKHDAAVVTARGVDDDEPVDADEPVTNAGPMRGGRRVTPEDLAVARGSADDAAEDEPYADDGRTPARGRGAAWLLHGADPCDPVHQPEIPSDFDSVSAEEITVAWPATVEIAEPLLLAHVVAGLLEEAALLTDSDRRARLVVMLHPTLEDLRLLPGAPKWATGLYDGAVHVVATPNRDFGVRLEGLRHEVMHAQMHVAAGCTPAWLNEGSAMFFAGRPPLKGWTRMLRDKETVDFDSLSVPSVADPASTKEGEVDVAYGQSLAMVLYAMERAKDGKLDGLVAALREARPQASSARATARGLWSSMYPSMSETDLRGWLARRVFGVTSASSLDAVYQGAVCCWGERRIGTYQCGAGATRPGETSWFDESVGPGARCTVGGP